MSVELVEHAVELLGDLVEEVAFIGGATVGLWITDPLAPPPRPTKDVDAIVEVANLREFHAFEERLRRQRFTHDQSLICRWNHPSGLILDVMPLDAGILGFANRWQGVAFADAQVVVLPSGREIRAIAPPYLVATKIEAFKGRGDGFWLGSHDFADVVSLLDGRLELVDEIRESSVDLKDFIGDFARELLHERQPLGLIQGQLLPDARSQRRADEILRRFGELAGFA